MATEVAAAAILPKLAADPRDRYREQNFDDELFAEFLFLGQARIDVAAGRQARQAGLRAARWRSFPGSRERLRMVALVQLDQLQRCAAGS